MRARDLADLVYSRPFVPLRIHTTEGQSYEVRHPELLSVLRSWVEIGESSHVHPLVQERVHHISLLHVVRVEKSREEESPATET